MERDGVSCSVAGLKPGRETGMEYRKDQLFGFEVS